MPYFLVPLVAWFVAGVLKFAINAIQHGSDAKKLIGNGGFPSNHTTVITSITSLIGLNEGWYDPAFGLGIAVLMIVIFDASGIRRQVGYHATYLNTKDNEAGLRERVGHSKIEIAGGLILGILISLGFHICF
ncbi:acid phosphatase [Paenibacillus swuensis]|uniref:Acid phosphatase n=1 Tax=Paenibacillus swuensis TaxID=1178515 RepID=A0A172TJH4_9BACL|nr:divergent PAP2 family protein [Paenibacillus swuensis]ANE47054.1 acid phosphatase [Paenibacillus swuensis]